MMLLTPLHLGPDAENSCIDKQSYHEGLETAYDFITNGKQDPKVPLFKADVHTELSTPATALSLNEISNNSRTTTLQHCCG